MSTPDLEDALDVVLQSTRSHMWSCDHTKAVSSDIAGKEAARDFLVDREQKQLGLRLLEIHATRDAFIRVQGELLPILEVFGQEETPNNGPARNASSTGAQLLVSNGGSRVTIETPWDSKPYVYLSMITPGSRSHSTNNDGRQLDANLVWAGIIVHDSQFLKMEKFRSSNSTLTSALLLVGWLAEKYLEHLHKDRKELETRIEILKMPVQNGQIMPLGKSVLKLNECNREVHTLQLDLRTSFSLEFANWASDIMKFSELESAAQRLLYLASRHPELPSNQFRDKIAETRAEIADLAAQQRQEQDELQRARAYQLQELSIRIAEDSRRDSRTMRGIAWVTMAFLPATFVTSFFGMNFFDGIADEHVFDGTSRNIWVFFVIALPISAMVLVIFWWWDRKTQVLERVEREAREKALAS